MISEFTTKVRACVIVQNNNFKLTFLQNYSVNFISLSVLKKSFFENIFIVHHVVFKQLAMILDVKKNKFKHQKGLGINKMKDVANLTSNLSKISHSVSEDLIVRFLEIICFTGLHEINLAPFTAQGLLLPVTVKQ